jgi:hypothetical protein
LVDLTARHDAAVNKCLPLPAADELATLAQIATHNRASSRRDLQFLFYQVQDWYKWDLRNRISRARSQQKFEVIAGQLKALRKNLENLNASERKHFGLFRLTNKNQDDIFEVRLLNNDLIDCGYFEVSDALVDDLLEELMEWSGAAALGASETGLWQRREASRPPEWSEQHDPTNPDTSVFNYFVVRVGEIVRGHGGNLSYVNDSFTGTLVEFLRRAEPYLPNGFLPFDLAQADEDGTVKGKTILRTLSKHWPKLERR